MSTNRTAFNIVIDLIAAALFFAMLATGYLLRYPLPPGSNKLYTLWGLSRHQWGDIHFWISLALLITMIVHLALHWNWVVTVIGKRFGLVSCNQPPLLRCAVWTILALIGFSLGFAWVVDSNVTATDRPRQGRRMHTEQYDAATTAVPSAPSNPPQSQPLVWNDIYPLFETNCLGCHGPKTQLANFRADQRQDFFRPEAPLVVPKQSEKSPLVAIISGTRTDIPMAEKHRLPPDDIARIKAWIDQGAE